MDPVAIFISTQFFCFLVKLDEEDSFFCEAEGFVKHLLYLVGPDIEESSVSNNNVKIFVGELAELAGLANLELNIDETFFICPALPLFYGFFIYINTNEVCSGEFLG